MNSIINEEDVKDQYLFAEILHRDLPQFQIQTSLDRENLKNVHYVIIWREYPNYLNLLPNFLFICKMTVEIHTPLSSIHSI